MMWKAATVDLIALAYSESLEIEKLLSPPHDSRQLSFFLASCSSLFLSCLLLFLILSGFRSISGWFLFLSGGHFNTTCPCSLVILDRLALCFFLAEESAGTCCPSYFMPHCDRDPVFSFEHSVCNATQSQPRP